MKAVPADIKNGTFAKRFIDDQDAGALSSRELRAKGAAHPIEENAVTWRGASRGAVAGAGRRANRRSARRRCPPPRSARCCDRRGRNAWPRPPVGSAPGAAALTTIVRGHHRSDLPVPRGRVRRGRSCVRTSVAQGRSRPRQGAGRRTRCRPVGWPCRRPARRAGPTGTRRKNAASAWNCVAHHRRRPSPPPAPARCGASRRSTDSRARHTRRSRCRRRGRAIRCQHPGR